MINPWLFDSSDRTARIVADVRAMKRDCFASRSSARSRSLIRPIRQNQGLISSAPGYAHPTGSASFRAHPRPSSCQCVQAVVTASNAKEVAELHEKVIGDAHERLIDRAVL